MTCAALAQRRDLGRAGTTGHAEPVVETDVASSAPATAVRRHLSPGSLLGRVAGWTVVLLGIALMPLPGPGTLVVVAGLRILVPHHAWAASIYDRVRDGAVAAARAGVSTGPRIAASVAGVAWVAVLTGAYAVDASIPEVGLLGLSVGPSLPFHSTATVVGLVVSCLASAAATGYSIVRLRPRSGSATA